MGGNTNADADRVLERVGHSGGDARRREFADAAGSDWARHRA